MIIVNYWRDVDYDYVNDSYVPISDNYSLHLAGVVNDALDLHNDIEGIKDAIENADDFEPKAETLYEIYLTRATINADPIPEPAFAIDKIVEKVRNPHTDQWETPIVRM